MTWKEKKYVNPPLTLVIFTWKINDENVTVKDLSGPSPRDITGETTWPLGYPWNGHQTPGRFEIRLKSNHEQKYTLEVNLRMSTRALGRLIA